MSDQQPLFDASPWEIEAPAEADLSDLSADRRRTLRQQQQIRDGIHPLTHGPLHEQASRERTRADGTTDLFTCGTCCHRLPGSGQYQWPKCEIGRQSRSAATDVRAWWPACQQYLPTRPTALPPEETP